MGADTITLTLPSKLEYLSLIDSFVSEIAGRMKFSQDKVADIRLAVDEACTNVIEHVYGFDEDKTYSISCQREKDRLIITIRDKGKGFNLADIPEPNVNADLDERKPGGLGLYFMKKFMDEVKFKFKPGVGNETRMVKYL